MFHNNNESDDKKLGRISYYSSEDENTIRSRAEESALNEEVEFSSLNRSRRSTKYDILRAGVAGSVIIYLVMAGIFTNWNIQDFRAEIIPPIIISITGITAYVILGKLVVQYRYDEEEKKGLVISRPTREVGQLEKEERVVTIKGKKDKNMIRQDLTVGLREMMDGNRDRVIQDKIKNKLVDMMPEYISTDEEKP